MRYEIKYDNDTGPRDESFYEWWGVIDTQYNREICRCDREMDAIEIAMMLNAKHEVESNV